MLAHTIRQNQNDASNPKRWGAAAVEFALVAPLMFFVVFATIELARLVSVHQQLKNATREAARQVASRSSTTIATLRTEARTTLNSFLPASQTSSATVTYEYQPVGSTTWATLGDSDDPSTVVTSGQLVRVTIGPFTYKNITWLPLGGNKSAIENLDNKQVGGTTTRVVAQRE